MATGTAALAQKLVNKKSTTTSKPAKKKVSTSNKKSSSVKSTHAAPRSKNNTTHPWLKIKSLYEKGVSRNEIAKQCKIKPSTMNGIMDRLAAGTVMVDGKVVKIMRGGKKSSK